MSNIEKGIYLLVKPVNPEWALLVKHYDKVLAVLKKGSFLECCDRENEVKDNFALNELIRLYNRHGEQQTFEVISKLLSNIS